MLLATDFSEYSKKVVNYGFELKKRLGCDVDLVHIIDTHVARQHDRSTFARQCSGEDDRMG